MATLDTILNIQVKGTDQMTKLKTSIDATAKELKDLQKEGKKAGQTQDQYNAKVVTAETKLKALRGELTRGKTELIKNARAAGDTSKSYDSLTKQNAKLSAQLRKLSDPLGKNSKEFTKLSSKINTNTNALKKMDAQMGRQQRNVGGYGTAIKGVAMAIGGAILAFKALERAMGVFVDFEFQIKQVGVISGATAAEMEKLSDQAKALGSSTSFAAGEVAGLQVELAKAGFKTTEIEAMTSSILDLAFAFGNDLSTTATQVGVTLKAFNLDASEASRVTDVMAASFSNSLLDLEKFSVAMPKVATLAKQMGFSLEDTTSLLGVLADTGMEASTSATALKNIFLKLADPTGALAMELGRGISSVDELIPALKELEESGVDVAGMLELTDKRSVTAFATLLNGTEDVSKLNKILLESEGTTKRFADAMKDSLKGSLDATTSAAQGFAIELFEKLAPAITLLLDGVQLVFNVLSKLTPVIVTATTAFVAYKAVVIANIALQRGMAIATIAYNSIAAIMTGTLKIATIAQRAFNLAAKANPIGLLVAALVAAASAFGFFSDSAEESSGSVDELSESEKRLMEQNERLERQANTRRKSQAQEIQVVRDLIKTIKDETNSRGERLKATKELNSIAGTTITNLTNEKKLAKELEGAYNDTIAAIKAKYILQASEAEILGLIKQELKLGESIKNNNEDNLKINGKILKNQRAVSNLKLEEITLIRQRELGQISESVFLNTSRKLNENIVKIQEKNNFLEADKGRNLDSNLKSEEQILKSVEEQNKVQRATDKVIDGLVVKEKIKKTTTSQTLTLYQKIKKEVSEESAELTRLLVLKQQGKNVDEQIAKQTIILTKAKTKLNDVDKEIRKIQDDINESFKESENAVEEKLLSTQKQIDEDQKMLSSMQLLKDNGADLADEIIAQSIKIAKAKLDMAMIAIKADDASTQAQVDNINKLKGELAGFEAVLNESSQDGTTPISGFVNKMLFGSGDEDGEGYTGGDFLNDLQVTLGAVSSVLNEVSANQNAQTEKQLGVIETAKNKEIEAFKETSEFAMMSTEEQDTALVEMQQTFDNEMLALKVAQFKKDQQMAVSQALINGGMSIMNIIGASATGNAIADGIIKGILIASSIAMTGIQLSTIKAQQPPTAELGGVMDNSFFKNGGMVFGNSHAQGGEKFAVGGRVAELEGGEAVINKKSTAMFKPLLSNLNVAGGGRKFADGGMVFDVDSITNESNMIDVLAGALSNQQVLLVEADVTNSQKNVKNIESRITF
tara:strand:+ start:15822 stop:19604 length:3783 start_codon:yes stop_codon:yes gene_type:complete